MTEQSPALPRTRIALSEVVLRTPHYERLCAFYALVLQQPPTLDMTPESGVGTTDPDVPTRIAFFNLPITDYPYTQRVSIFECADVGGTGARAVGLHHLQLRFGSLDALFDQYQALREQGHHPVESANHGIATSLYYRDPDGNRVEFSGLNFPDEQTMREYMQTETFRRMPDGVAIDPERFQREHRAGVPWADLVRLS